jgi:hypothetical protein
MEGPENGEIPIYNVWKLNAFLSLSSSTNDDIDE